jgi:three-Cys-motif partner protein
MQDNSMLKQTSRYKHKILEEYFSAWLKRYGRNHRTLFYIDFFAGPGKYSNHFPGSPLVVLRAARKILRGTRTKLCMILIEKQKSIYTHLNQEILHSFTPGENIQIFNICGNSYQVGGTLVNILQEKYPSFCFVDPYGFPLPVSLLNKILSRPNTEIFLNFMYFRILMSLHNPKCRFRMNELFGHKYWYRNFKHGQYPAAPECHLLTYYESKLMSEYKTRFRIPFSPEDRVSNPLGRTKYYLLHLTNSRNSYLQMHKILQRFIPIEKLFLKPNSFSGE